MVVHEGGTVESVAGGSARVRVRPARPEACQHCRACEPAGQGVFLLQVEAGDLRPGDRVTVEVPLPGTWRAIGFVLALPLAAMVAGAVLGAEWRGLREWLGLDADATSLLAALVLATVALASAAACERRFRRRHRPRVLQVHPSDADNDGFA
ncbi:MAG: SoxR reducing system RseC family protein [Phycisphaerae bacterium]